MRKRLGTVPLLVLEPAAPAAMSSVFRLVPMLLPKLRNSRKVVPQK